MGRVVARCRRKYRSSYTNASLSIPQGAERARLLGRSGCGKSTLMKLVARLYQPEKGTIYLGGDKLNDVVVSDEIAMWRAAARGSSLKKAQTIPLPIGRLVKVLESHTVHPLEWLHTEQAHDRGPGIAHVFVVTIRRNSRRSAKYNPKSLTNDIARSLVADTVRTLVHGVIDVSLPTSAARASSSPRAPPLLAPPGCPSRARRRPCARARARTRPSPRRRSGRGRRGRGRGSENAPPQPGGPSAMPAGGGRRQVALSSVR